MIFLSAVLPEGGAAIFWWASFYFGPALRPAGLLNRVGDFGANSVGLRRGSGFSFGDINAGFLAKTFWRSSR